MKDLISHWLFSSASLAARYLPARLSHGIYRFPGLANLIRSMLNRAVKPGLQEVIVAGGELQGLRLWLDLREEKDYWLGTYEPELMRACRDLVKPGMIAYDVGANIGYISLMLAKLVGVEGRVFAFEALPSNVVRLKRNIEMNDMKEKVTVIRAAVVQESRVVRFLSGPSSATGKAQGSAGRKIFHSQNELLVDGISIDDFIFHRGFPAPQIIKMDIEGGEVLALPGMKRTLEEKKPILLLELHGEEAILVTCQILTNAGYRLGFLRQGFPRVASFDTLGQKAYLAAFPEP